MAVGAACQAAAASDDPRDRMAGGAGGGSGPGTRSGTPGHDDPSSTSSSVQGMMEWRSTPVVAPDPLSLVSRSGRSPVSSLAPCLP